MDDVSGLVFTVTENTTGGNSGFNLSEDEFYPTTLVAIEKYENPNQKFGPQLNWKFELEGEQYSYEWEGKKNQQRIQGSTSMICSPKSKLYAWYSKLNGAEPKPGDKVNLQNLIGLKCSVMVKASKGKDKNGAPTTWWNVEKVKLREGNTQTTTKSTSTAKTTETPKPVPQVAKPKPTEDLLSDIDIF